MVSCRRVIEQVMQNLKGTAAEGQVSYADLIALGGAYAVFITGGPTIDVPIGEHRPRFSPQFCSHAIR